MTSLQACRREVCALSVLGLLDAHVAAAHAYPRAVVCNGGASCLADWCIGACSPILCLMRLICMLRLKLSELCIYV